MRKFQYEGTSSVGWDEWQHLVFLHERIVTSEGEVDGGIECSSDTTFSESLMGGKVCLEFGEIVGREAHQQLIYFYYSINLQDMNKKTRNYNLNSTPENITPLITPILIPQLQTIDNTSLYDDYSIRSATLLGIR